MVSKRTETGFEESEVGVPPSKGPAHVTLSVDNDSHYQHGTFDNNELNY
jgi:hypothetical protein